MFRASVKFFRTLSSCYFSYCRYYAKDIKIGSDVHTTMQHGIDALSNAVAVTLGPNTRKTIIDPSIGSPRIRKDGVSIAQAIELRNRLQDIGAKLVHELANKTSEETGDGATVATVLARAIAKGGFQKISEGSSPTEIRRGIMLAIKEVKRRLKAISRSVSTPEEIQQVANIYSNGEKDISSMICEAISKACCDGGGTISIMKGKGLNDEVEVVEGMKLNSGYISPYFINSPLGEKVDFQNALLLLTENKVSSVKTIMSVVELVSSKRMPLVIVADDVTTEALKALVLGRLRTGLRVAAIKAPGCGADNKRAILNDIAVATGGSVFGDHIGMGRLEDVRLSDLGKVGNVVITKDDTLLLNGMGKRDYIVQRVDQIKDQIAGTRIPLRKKNLKERLANLVSGIVLIHVGGATEREVNEKIERLKTALHATRAAIEEGIVPGGGIALLKCIRCLDSIKGSNQTQRMGVEIVKRALRMPCVAIAANAGVDASLVIAHIESQKDDDDDCGCDAFKGEYGNLVEMGIVDPTKVIRTAIADAAGVASLLMTAETVIADISKDK